MARAPFLSGEGVPDPPGELVQLGTRRPLPVARREAQAKAVAGEARQDVQVHVVDLLPRRCAIGQVEVHPLAPTILGMRLRHKCYRY